MRSFGWFILREIHDQTRSHRFLVITAIAGLLTPLVVYAGVNDYLGRRLKYDLFLEQRVAADAASRPLGFVTGHALEPSLRLVRPPHPASIIVRGFDAVLPQYWDVAPDGLHRGNGGDGVAPGVSLDLEFVVRVILGLLAVLLAAGALASERDTGVLYVLLAQPVNASSVLGAKLIAGAAALLLALAVVLSTAAASIGLFGPELWSRDLPFALAGVAGAGALYLFGLYVVGVLVGLRSSSSSAANVIAVSMWLLLAVASVPMIDVMSRVLFPAPAPELVIARREQTVKARNKEIAAGLGNWYLPRAPVNWSLGSTPVPAAEASHIREVWSREARDLRRELTTTDGQAATPEIAQRRLRNAASWLSPASMLFRAASRLAGTGSPTVERWEEVAEAHQRRTDETLFDPPPRVTLSVPIDSGSALVTLLLRPVPPISALQPNVVVEITRGRAFAEAATSLAALAGYALALVALAFWWLPKTRY